MHMSNKPNTPKGMRDFLPHKVIRRNYIMDVIKTQFERFGFLPIETPSMERRDLLLGKYGDEGDRLVFKVLNSGEKVKKADLDALEKGELSRFGNSIAEKAMRYDLTATCPVCCPTPKRIKFSIQAISNAASLAC